MESIDSKKTAELLKESLRIVDELAKIDVDNFLVDEDDMDKLETLIKRAIKLTKNRLWKLN